MPQASHVSKSRTSQNLQQLEVKVTIIIQPKANAIIIMQPNVDAIIIIQPKANAIKVDATMIMQLNANATRTLCNQKLRKP